MNKEISNILTNKLKELTISQDFIDKFIYNYQHKDEQVTSEYLYDWFTSINYKQSYRDFCKKYILSLDESQYSIDNSHNGISRGKLKKKYFITQQGMKEIMMQLSKESRQYFIKCESILFDIMIQQIQETQEQFDNLQQQIETLFIYEIHLLEKNMKYRGITNNVSIRIKDHISKSTNSYVRDSMKNKEPFKVYILAEKQCCNKEQQKFLESIFIEQIPLDIRCNHVIPQVNNHKLVPQQFKQECIELLNSYSQQEFDQESLTIQPINHLNIEEINSVPIENVQPVTTLNNDYDSVNVDDHLEYIRNEQLDCDFKQKIIKIRQFFDEHGEMPKETKSKTDQYSLAQFMNKIRQQYRNNNNSYDLSLQRFAFLQYHLPNVLLTDNKEFEFKQKVIRLKQFIQTNNHYPRCIKNPNDSQQNEVINANFLGKLRQLKKNQSISNDRITFVESQIPNFIWSQQQQNTINNLIELNSFIQQNQRLPKQKENKKLCDFTKQQINQALIDQYAPLYNQLL